MKEIRDEDRIISKICRGELSIVDRDIKNLESGNLSEQEEVNFRKLAQEINETIDRNQTIRKEMKEKISVAEQQYGDYLNIYNQQIEELKPMRDKLKYGSAWSMMLGALIFLASGFIPGIIVGMFTEALWVLITAVLLGSFTSMGVMGYRIYKDSLKADKIDEEIKELETKKLCIIEQSNEDCVDLSKAPENEIKRNIVRHIYNSKKAEEKQEDELVV